MGKKSRSKNKKRKIRKAVEPDEHYSYGPFEIARFGKLNVFRSNLTPEELTEVQAKLVNRFPIVCREIDAKISAIVKKIIKFDPTLLLQRAYWDMAVNHLNKQSEVDVDHNAAVSLRMLDYVQSIIASASPNKGNIEDLTEAEYTHLRNSVSDLFDQLNMEYQMCLTAFKRSRSSNIDEEFEEYHYRAQLYWCNVRGNRYLFHQRSHLQDLLSPHSDVLIELFGITSEQIIDDVLKIQHALTRGLFEALAECQEFQRVSIDALESKASTAEKLAEASLPDLMSNVIKENRWEKWKDRIFGSLLGLDLFDIEKVTNLPSKLLDELSWTQGQDVEFLSEGNFKGWPLRIWPIFKRPFIKLDGRYYCFELYSLLDNLYRVLQKTICRIKPDYREEWNEKQKQVSEQLPFKYLKTLLPSAQAYQSVYYKWYTSSERKKEWCETDGLMLYDDCLFVIEVKAGAFTYTSPALDFPSYIDSIKNLVLKPVEQGSRFFKYLESQEEVDIFDSSHNKICSISSKEFEHKQICAVTLDPFTEIAAQIQHLRTIGIDVGEHAVWSISIDDLRTYSEIFDNPLVFLHFVEHRMGAFKSILIQTDDELDHLGLYLKHNVYTQYVDELDSDARIVWHGYRSDIDRFFAQKLHDSNTLCTLKQGMPTRLREIIYFLNATNLKGRRKVASMLLNYGQDWRDIITSEIDNSLSAQRLTGKPKPFSTYGETRITLFSWQEGILNRDLALALEHTKAAMLVTNDSDRLLLEVFFENTGAMKGIDFKFLSLESLGEYELRKLRPVAETLRKNRIEKVKKDGGKIGRNAPCPCGSGKKYKKCCLISVSQPH